MRVKSFSSFQSSSTCPLRTPTQAHLSLRLTRRTIRPSSMGAVCWAASAACKPDQSTEPSVVEAGEADASAARSRARRCLSMRGATARVALALWALVVEVEDEVEVEVCLCLCFLVEVVEWCLCFLLEERLDDDECATFAASITTAPSATNSPFGTAAFKFASADADADADDAVDDEPAEEVGRARSAGMVGKPAPIWRSIRERTAARSGEGEGDARAAEVRAARAVRRRSWG